MAVRTLDDILADSHKRQTFSNSTELHAFQWNICRGCAWEDDCNVIDAILSNLTPREIRFNDGKRPVGCTVRETPTEKRARERREAHAQLEAMHYPMFVEPK